MVIPRRMIRILQKVKYIWLAVLLISILTGWYAQLQGMSPWDVFSMLTAGRLPGATYKIGINPADSDHDRNVHPGTISSASSSAQWAQFLL